jgi:integrase
MRFLPAGCSLYGWRFFSCLRVRCSITNQSSLIHDFRHCHATWALGEGVSAKIVQERLGHSNIAITLGLYSHADEGMQAGMAEMLDERFQPE